MAEVTPIHPAPREPAVAPQPARRRRRTVIAIAVVVVLVLLVALYIFLRYYVDWLWFGEVGLRTVFWKRVTLGLILAPVFGIAFFAVVYGNIEIARRLAPRYRPLQGVDVVELVHESAFRWVRWGGIAIAVLGGVAAASSAAGAWLVFARAFAGVPFGVSDPIFHNDVSFYVFALPAWQYIFGFLFGTLVATLVITIIAHLLLGGVEVRQRPSPQIDPRAEEWRPRQQVNPAIEQLTRVTGVDVEPGTVAHISALLGALFVVGGAGYLLQAWGLLYSTAGVVFGAGYTDVHVRLPLIWVVMVITIGLGAALIYNAVRRRRKIWLPAAMGIWLASVVVLLILVPAVFQALIVNPNQLGKETPYITYNIAATRTAYDLTKISSTPYSLQGDLSAASLKINDVTVRNIRLWDPQVLLRSYGQLQELRPYYSFTTVGVDRYPVNGVYTQTMLAPRELRVSGLPPQAQTWVNQHITYTHGYGVALSAVNQVASGGSPDFLVQNVPPVSSAPSLQITQPRIYYGLLGTNYVLVKTKDPAFDYPGPSGDVYSGYTGTGGIPVSSFLNRLAFTARFADIKFFTSSAITGASRVIIYNNIRARLAAAAPFLRFDSNPYMVIAGGRLYWIADAYTTTGLIPYSQPNGGLNYIRNSVKVVIDAYNGTMRFYDFAPTDPLIRTYERIFPGMFRPASTMPSTLLQHVRYPEDYFRTQAEMFSTYHVTDPGVLYNKGNQWQIPVNLSITGAAPQSAYYTIMRLPGQTREEFVLIVPYTPNGRSNMIAWLGAQSDQPNYGKAVSFEFPSSGNVYGPAQVEAAINQDPTISAQRTLWGQQGSTVIFGNLLTIPIGNSLLYVQPLYLQSSTTPVPQLQRVIVFYRSPSATPNLPTGQQQNVVMAPTLGDALALIFGGAPATGTQPPIGPTTPGTTSPAVARLIAQADAQYAAAQAALRAGDLTTFGQQIKALGQTLTQLKTTH